MTDTLTLNQVVLGSVVGYVGIYAITMVFWIPKQQPEHEPSKPLQSTTFVSTRLNLNLPNQYIFASALFPFILAQYFPIPIQKHPIFDSLPKMLVVLWSSYLLI
ncbi:hypothetical protein HK102_007848, partial [Quaeritorhiza haematococci]